MYLTTKDIIGILKISRTKLHYMRQSGAFIEGIRVGRSVRFSEDQFNDWLGIQTKH